MAEDNDKPASQNDTAAGGNSGVEFRTASADASGSPEALLSTLTPRKNGQSSHRYDIHQLLNNYRYTRRLMLGLGLMLLLILGISLGFVTGFFGALTTLLLTGALLALTLLALLTIHWWRKFKSKL